jgi:hypothetical protein
MPYDDRLIIKERYISKGDGVCRTNILKVIEFDDFLQLYIKNGHGASRGIKLDKPMTELLRKFLNNVEIGVDKDKRTV